MLIRSLKKPDITSAAELNLAGAPLPHLIEHAV